MFWRQQSAALENEGEKTLTVSDWSQFEERAFQVGNIDKALGSASKVVRKANRVVFDTPEWFFQNKTTNDRDSDEVHASREMPNRREVETHKVTQVPFRRWCACFFKALLFRRSVVSSPFVAVDLLGLRGNPIVKTPASIFTALSLSMILGFASTSKTPLESSKSCIACLQRPRVKTGGEMVTCLGRITAAWVRDVVGGDKPKKDVAVYKFFFVLFSALECVAVKLLCV